MENSYSITQATLPPFFFHPETSTNPSEPANSLDERAPEESQSSHSPPKSTEKKKFLINLTGLPTFQITPHGKSENKTESSAKPHRKSKVQKVKLPAEKNDLAKIEKIKNNRLPIGDEAECKFLDTSSRSSEAISPKSVDAISSETITPKSSASSRSSEAISPKSSSAGSRSSETSRKSSDTTTPRVRSLSVAEFSPRSLAQEKAVQKRKVYQSRKTYNPAAYFDLSKSSSQESKDSSILIQESPVNPHEGKFIIVDPIQSKKEKFEKLRIMEGYEAELFEKSLKLNPLDLKENFGSKTLMSDGLQNFYTDSIKDLALLNIFNHYNEENPFLSRAIAVVKSMQNKLLSRLQIDTRLKEFREYLVNQAISKNGVTPLIKFLYRTVDELTFLATPALMANDKENIIKTKSSFHQFMDCIAKIKDDSYQPKGEFFKKRFNKKILPIIYCLCGDSETLKYEVLTLLTKWINTEKKVQELKDLIHIFTFDQLQKMICKLEFLWNEPVEHSFVSIFSPIDKIPPKDVRDYVRLKIPFTINGEVPFSGYKSDIVWKPDQFFFKLILSLHAAFGYEKPDENGLKMEIESFLKAEDWEDVKFSDQTNKCFRILKMGCINVAFRGFYYLQLRLGNKFHKSFDLNAHKNISINFCIEKAQVYVEHIRECKVSEKNHLDPLCIIQTSWKVPFAQDNMWNCVLKLLDINMDANMDAETSKAVELHLMNLADDASIKKKLDIEMNMILNKDGKLIERSSSDVKYEDIKTGYNLLI